jgi:hypothetical protein
MIMFDEGNLNTIYIRPLSILQATLFMLIKNTFWLLTFWSTPSSASTPSWRKDVWSTVKFDMDGDGDGGFSELEAVDGVWSDLLERRTGGGCRGRKTKEKPVRL